MSTACAVQPIEVDELEVRHRQRVLAGIQTETFKNLFWGEFDNLREAIKERDWVEVNDTIESLEACAVKVSVRQWPSGHACNGESCSRCGHKR